MKTVTLVCKNCNQVFEVQPYRIREGARFCSPSCSSSYPRWHKYKRPENYNPQTYRLWHTMIRRCENKKTNGYNCYGAVGITVCDRWKGVNGYVNFIKDMGDRPSLKHTVDRENNNLGYTPDNCRWATHKEQALNRKDNHRLAYAGDYLTISEWATKTGIKRTTITARLKRGWCVEKALTFPV